MRADEIDCPQCGAFPADRCLERATTRGSYCFDLYCQVGNQMKARRGLKPVSEDAARKVNVPRVEVAIQEHKCKYCGFTQYRSFVQPKDMPLPKPRDPVCTVCFAQECIAYVKGELRKAGSQKKKAFIQEKLQHLNRRLEIILKDREKAEKASGCSQQHVEL